MLVMSPTIATRGDLHEQGGIMGRFTRIALSALLVAAGLLIAVPPASASAHATGRERFDGFLVASGASGQRQIVHSQIVARGVFDGIGRIVEIPNRPTDSDSVSRDDLVFRAGTMHIVSVNGAVAFTLDPASCAFKVTVQQTTAVEGGTGRFRHAVGTGVGKVVARGVAQRAADGSCSMDQAPILEVDVVSSRGSLSF
jgi:hypothetical protein